MNHKLAGLLMAAAITPACAMAEVNYAGDIYLGYGNAGDEEGALAALSYTLSNEQELGNGFKLTYKAGIAARTNQDAVGEIDNDNLDLEFGLDMGAGGKLTVTTFNPHGQKPWADGEIMDRGSVGVFPAIQPRFDGVGGVKAIVDNGTVVKAEGEAIVKYENHFGKLGVEIKADPFGVYGPYSGAETADLPDAQIKLTYPTQLGIYSIAANDQNDYLLNFVFPNVAPGLTVIGNLEVNNNDWNDTKSEVVASYRSENTGLFKGAFAIYALDSNSDVFVLSTNWGADNWNLMVGGDSHGDLAVEGSYKVNDRIEVLAGWDNGHDFIEGFNDAFNPPVFAPARDSGFEVGVRMTF